MSQLQHQPQRNQRIGTRFNFLKTEMPFRQRQINRRTRERIFFAVAILSLAVWLFMAAAEIYSPLHAWLHGGTIPKDDDDCAIVAIAHGKIETIACDIPVVVPVSWIEVTPRVEFSVFIPANTNLSFGRAPPALLAVS
jgi:hypothetical protein